MEFAALAGLLGLGNVARSSATRGKRGTVVIPVGCAFSQRCGNISFPLVMVSRGRCAAICTAAQWRPLRKILLRASKDKDGRVGWCLLNVVRLFLWRGWFLWCSLHSSGLGAVQGCSSPRCGEKDTERGNIFSKAEIYRSNISFCFCFYYLLAVPSLHIAMGCLSVALIHTHRVFVNYNDLRQNSEVLCGRKFFQITAWGSRHFRIKIWKAESLFLLFKCLLLFSFLLTNVP